MGWISIMPKGLGPLVAILDRQPKTILWMEAVLAALALGWLDYLTGFEASFGTAQAARASSRLKPLPRTPFIVRGG